MCCVAQPPANAGSNVVDPLTCWLVSMFEGSKPILVTMRGENRTKSGMLVEVWIKKVQMYYSVWLQLQLDVTEFTKEEGKTTPVM